MIRIKRYLHVIPSLRYGGAESFLLRSHTIVGLSLLKLDEELSYVRCYWLASIDSELDPCRDNGAPRSHRKSR